MYSITIEVPDHIKVDSRPKPILVKFKTEEEKDAYIKLEYRFTRDAIHALNAAKNSAARTEAWVNLYKQRKSMYELTTKNPTKPTPNKVA